MGLQVQRGIVAVPGEPGEKIDARILPDVLWLRERFKVDVTDGYAPTGHDPDGEHPVGLAVDLVPDFKRGGTWDDVDAAAAYAEKRPEVFRWIGYNGVKGHGRGHHLHLSWHGRDGGALKTLQGEGETRGGIGGLVDGAEDAVDGALGRVGDVVTGAAGDVATATARALVGLVADAIGADGARWVLTAALVLTAVALIAFGAARTVGLRAPVPPAVALTR